MFPFPSAADRDLVAARTDIVYARRAFHPESTQFSMDEWEEVGASGRSWRMKRRPRRGQRAGKACSIDEVR